MRLRYRLLSVIIILALTVTCMAGAYRWKERAAIGQEQTLRDDAFTALSDALTDTVTLHLWYTDPALTEYLNAQAVAWHEAHDNARLRIELVSAIDYLEAIQQVSVADEATLPDVFLTTHDTLEKAYLAGLATEVEDASFLTREGVYPKAAQNAVRYQGKLIAYPYYFETATLLYNRTYLEAAARDVLEDEALQEGKALVGTEVPLEDEAIAERVESYLPLTIADIMAFADSYNAPEEVEAVFAWDVNDIFNNYFFVGNYLNVGGDAGDDLAQIDIYNEEAIRCLKVYQQLNQFFAINALEVDSDSILQDFIDGKTVFSVTTTEGVRRIEEAKLTGNYSFDYGVAFMPDLTSELETRTMSVTNCIAVNGYTHHRKQANELARFLCADTSDAMQRMSGKCAARNGVDYGLEALDTFLAVYANSVPVPKMIETSNFWVYLEIVFTEVWNGADANDALRGLSERIKTQISGTEYVEMRLKDPPDDALEASDEDFVED